MSTWFCFDKELSPVVKIAVFDAGYLVAKKHPDMKDKVVPVAKGIVERVEAGGSNESMNLVFQQGIAALLEQIEDPIIKMNVLAVLESMVNFTPQTPAILTDKQLTGISKSFVAGMEAAG